jgi:NAD(P)-dependent dehydrogenase (short-subunit alcohol dehydrogenase family)
VDLGIAGLIALISGGDSGIGLATAKVLLAEGVRVIITDKTQESLDKAVAELGASAGSVSAYAADLTDAGDVDRLHSRVMAEVGNIDILVQAAGITGSQSRFHEIDDDGWALTIGVDLLAPVRLVRTFLPSLRSGGWGRLIFVASEDAVQPYDDELPYCAARAGLLALSKGLSRSYASEGLLVNAVSPAFIASPMTDAMMNKRAEQNGTSSDEAIESFLTEEGPTRSSAAAAVRRKSLQSSRSCVPTTPASRTGRTIVSIPVQLRPCRGRRDGSSRSSGRCPR